MNNLTSVPAHFTIRLADVPNALDLTKAQTVPNNCLQSVLVAQWLNLLSQQQRASSRQTRRGDEEEEDDEDESEEEEGDEDEDEEDSDDEH